MGFMHDTLAYMARDPVHRRYHHDEMTFGLMYAFSENFVLPLSPRRGGARQGLAARQDAGATTGSSFANLRAYYGFMWGHPGKKLLFMGQEICARARMERSARA
jgi:1,4-alpha-glucan branching enzyme